MKYGASIRNNFGIVISRYEQRNVTQFYKLIEQLKDFTSNIIIVINDDRVVEVNHTRVGGITYIRRPNRGMNIGAWSEAIQFCTEFEYTIFLQDEVYLVNRRFHELYDDFFSRPDVGLVSESINIGWAEPWDSLRKNNKLNYSVSLPDHREVQRIDHYLNLFKIWNIAPGESGMHSRSLALGIRGDVLRAISSFHIGANKEECIASEIAISKAIESLGLEVIQSSNVPFSCFYHPEWEWSGTKKRY